MLEEVSINAIFKIFLVFARIGTTLMLLPGLGDAYVNARTRLLLALLISIVSASSIDNIPPIPSQLPELVMHLFIEIIIGVFFGTIARFLISVIHVVGMIIGMQSGLGSATLFDPSQGTQGAMIGNFLSPLAISLLFITDMHHLLIMGMIESYHVFVPGKFVILGDFIESLARLASDCFDIAIKISAPQIVIGLILLLGGGVLARLTPSLQIFFLITPAQMIISFFILMITLSVTMMWYLEFVSENIKYFLRIE